MIEKNCCGDSIVKSDLAATVKIVNYTKTLQSETVNIIKKSKSRQVGVFGDSE